jgi:hypothetical protein
MNRMEATAATDMAKPATHNCQSLSFCIFRYSTYADLTYTAVIIAHHA